LVTAKDKVIHCADGENKRYARHSNSRRLHDACASEFRRIAAAAATGAHLPQKITIVLSERSSQDAASDYEQKFLRCVVLARQRCHAC